MKRINGESLDDSPTKDFNNCARKLKNPPQKNGYYIFHGKSNFSRFI